MSEQTIALLREGSGLNFDRYVQRVFRSAETAHKFANSQDRNVIIRRLPGKFKAGDVVPFGVKGESL